MGRYAAIVWLALRQELQIWPTLIARVGFLGVILMIFSRLWQTAFSSGFSDGLTDPGRLIWYLAITEWIVLSVPSIQLQIEDDVRSGEYFAGMIRPISPFHIRLCQGLGQLVVRLVVVGLAGIAIAFFEARAIPFGIVQGATILALGVCAAVGALLMQAMIGLSAIKLHETAPLFWVWQKLLFVLGGLMLPLTIYPEWFQRLCMLLPFSAFLNGVGRLALHWNIQLAVESTGALVFWMFVIATALRWFERRSYSLLQVGGG